jgi:hypothetical protein
MLPPDGWRLEPPVKKIDQVGARLYWPYRPATELIHPRRASGSSIFVRLNVCRRSGQPRPMTPVQSPRFM